MNFDLKPYPSYKDSGVEWLGDVPEHWELVRNKSLFRRQNRIVGEKHPQYTLLSLTKKGIIKRDMVNAKGKFPSDFSTYQEVRPDNFVFCFFDVDETPRGVGLSQFFGMITGAYTVFDCLAPVPEYLLYYYTNLDDLKALKPLYTGLRKVIPVDQFLRTKSPLPTLPEQVAIVRFLDFLDKRIRKSINAKKKLIKLLEEEKQAIINRVVTRGLDPDVKMKPSGVDWLGDIPEHWAIKRCRYIFHEIDMRSVDGTEEHLSMSQSLGLVPSHLVTNRTLISESYAGGKLCEVGDIVLNRLKAHLGVFALSNYNGVISPDYTVLRIIDSSDPVFLETLLRSQLCRTELYVRAKGIVEGFWRLYTDDFYDIYLPIPPFEEQTTIINFLEKEATRINKVIDAENREIILLSEYRTRMISAVVTGKLDVREATAGLPEETEEPEDIEEIEPFGDPEDCDGIGEELVPGIEKDEV